MIYHYLVASLPLLNLEDPAPFTLHEFCLKCQGVLGEEDRRDLLAVAAGRPGEGKSGFCRKWHGVDTQLRNAVARVRAASAGLDAKPMLRDHPGFSVYVEKMVAEAFGRAHPLDRERLLDRCRWEMLDQLALEQPFGLSAVLAFAVKLQLVERWAAMKDETGKKVFDKLVTTYLEREGYLTEFEVDVE